MGSLNYWLVATIALVVALIAAALPLKLKEESPGRVVRAAAVLCVVVGCVYGMLGLIKYQALAYGLWDFGIYDSMMHNFVQGRGFPVDFRGKFDHFSPLAIVPALLYFLWDGPVVLILFQSAVMAAGGWVFFCLARHYLGESSYSLLFAVMYLLNPYYSRIVQFDFHIECLFPLLFFGAFLALAKRRDVWFYVLLLSCVLVKEDFIVPLGAVGLFRCFQRGRRLSGVLLIASAGAWTFFVLKVYFPHLLGMAYWHYGRYELLAPTLGGTFDNVAVLVGRALRPESWAVLASVLLPCALLPPGYWKGFLFLFLPVLGIQLISGSDQQSLLMSHYASAMIAVGPLAALFGFRVLRYKFRGRKVLMNRLVVFAWTLVVFSSFLFTESFTVRYYHYLRNYLPEFHPTILSLPLRPDAYGTFAGLYDHAERIHRLAQITPKHWRIIAQNELGNVFLRHKQVGSLPENEATPEANRNLAKWWDGKDADMVLFDQRLHRGFDSIGEINVALKALLKNPRYVLAIHQGPLIVFVRKDRLHEVNFSDIFKP